jgi:hypothetical protein
MAKEISATVSITGRACKMREMMKANKGGNSSKHFQAKWNHLAARKMRPKKSPNAAGTKPAAPGDQFILAQRK